MVDKLPLIFYSLLERMRVAWLQQPRRTRWHHDRPNARVHTCPQDILMDVQATRIQQKNRLEVLQVRAQGRAQQLNDADAHRRIVPCNNECRHELLSAP